MLSLSVYRWVLSYFNLVATALLSHFLWGCSPQACRCLQAGKKSAFMWFVWYDDDAQLFPLPKHAFIICNLKAVMTSVLGYPVTNGKFWVCSHPALQCIPIWCPMATWGRISLPCSTCKQTTTSFCPKNVALVVKSVEIMCPNSGKMLAGFRRTVVLHSQTYLSTAMTKWCFYTAKNPQKQPVCFVTNNLWMSTTGSQGTLKINWVPSHMYI